MKKIHTSSAEVYRLAWEHGTTVERDGTDVVTVVAGVEYRGRMLSAAMRAIPWVDPDEPPEVVPSERDYQDASDAEEARDVRWLGGVG